MDSGVWETCRIVVRSDLAIQRTLPRGPGRVFPPIAMSQLERCSGPRIRARAREEEARMGARALSFAVIVAAGQPVVIGGVQGGIAHLGSLYWGKSLTL
jgi:hypothetical protein